MSYPDLITADRLHTSIWGHVLGFMRAKLPRPTIESMDVALAGVQHSPKPIKSAGGPRGPQRPHISCTGVAGMPAAGDFTGVQARLRHLRSTLQGYIYICMYAYVYIYVQPQDGLLLQ